MVALTKTSEIIYDTNRVQNQTLMFVSRKVAATDMPYTKWEVKHLINWKRYQIKETDFRAKTATFTSSDYFDLTTGVYQVLITSPHHEDFGGVILKVDYDEDTGLYDYQCQDFSRFYQSKFELIRSNITLYRLLVFLITKGKISTKGAVTKAMLNSYKNTLSGLRPAYQYEQSKDFNGSTISFNPMTEKVNILTKDKSLMEVIRDYVNGSGAYIDCYIDKYGIIRLEPFHKDDFFNTGLYLTTPEIASRKFTFDTTNIITGVIVKSNNTLSGGNGYSAKELTNLSLSSFFGNITTSISNPNDANLTIKGSSGNTSTANKTSSASTKKATTPNKNKNVYGTKKKVVHLNMDYINSKSSDYAVMNSMKSILKKNGWTVKIAGWGPNSHYKNRGKVKKGIWFCLYGGACAGTLREHATSSWFLNPLKKNKSRVVIGFFPPSGDIRKGGKYYKHLGPAHDWQGSMNYANINYPAEFLSKNGVPFMYANNAKNMVAKFLAGGDNYKKYANGWTKHDVKWIK